MTYKNLVPGQFQIGDIVFGRGTNIIVSNWDAKPYDVNQQDYQVPRADEARFGWDNFKPTSLEFDMTILYNKLLPGNEHILPNFWKDMPTVMDLSKEWRFDEGRQIWGMMKPLYVRNKIDEIPKIIFGRPGQFGSTSGGDHTVHVTAEYRRADTLAYSIDEEFISISGTSIAGSINGTRGQATSWMRIELVGPIKHPVMTFTNMFNQNEPVVIDLDYEVSAGETVYISSYPWTRSVINSGTPPINLSANLIGSSPYLDRLRFDFDAIVGFEVYGENMTSDTRFTAFWRDTFTVV